MRRLKRIGSSGLSRTLSLAIVVLVLCAGSSVARADTYDCSAVAMYKFTDGGLEPHHNFRVDTARAFVRVGANVAGMKEMKLVSPVAIRQFGGWVGQLHDETGVYRGTLELRTDLPFANGGSRAHKLDFIWSGTLHARPEYVLTGTCTFAGA